MAAAFARFKPLVMLRGPTRSFKDIQQPDLLSGLFGGFWRVARRRFQSASAGVVTFALGSVDFLTLGLGINLS